MATPSGMHSIEHVLLFTLLQMAVIIAAARCFGHLALKLNQPRAVGEIVAGLLLGPSLFGWLFPQASDFLFHSVDAMPISVMSQIGLILLMFHVGLEFDFRQLNDKSTRLAVSLVSMFGIVVPFLVGIGLAALSWHSLAQAVNPVAYGLFLATALSITAVPILGRIMMEYQLTSTRIGVITISSAAINDAVGWLVLALITAVVAARFQVDAFLTQITYIALYVVVMCYAVRPAIVRMMPRFKTTTQVPTLPQDLAALLLLVVFASAMLSSLLGLFAIFGGFMAGVILHDQHDVVRGWRHSVADVVTVLLLPIFFTYSGLRTNVGGLDTAWLWGWFALVMVAATAGKFGGCYLAARLSRLSHVEASCIGIMMNTRALMELIVVNIGLDLGVIPQPVFTMLVLMAIASTMMTAPGLRRWLPQLRST